MTVYVDDVRHEYRHMIMCHMWADSLEELLTAVDNIGVQRKWIQGHPTLSLPYARKASWVHFDIALSKKALALKQGAVLTDQFGPTEHIARQHIASGNPFFIKVGQRMLKLVKEARGRRA